MVSPSRADHVRLSLYFNITDHCNSGCIFCAASIPDLKKRAMVPSKYVLQIYDRYHLGPGDEVVINGGEPTVYPSLELIISEAANRGARVILFTNGRLLYDLNRARKWLGAGVYKVSVPLYGSNADTHDRLTRRAGSFAQTVTGIRNAFSLRTKIGFPAEIELKLLAVRDSLQEWPEIIDLIAKEFGAPNVLVMSGLHMWSTAIDSYARLSPTLAQMHQFVNLALQRAAIYRMPVSFWSIPLCILTRENRERFLVPAASSESSSRVRVIYFDPRYPDGVEYSNEEFHPKEEVESVCQECHLAQRCGPGRVFYQQLLAVSV